MPRDSGGAYTLPAGNPVAADTLIDSAWANGTLTDLGNEMSNTLHKDGRASMTGPLVLSTRGSPLDTDAASWENVLTRINTRVGQNFPNLGALQAFRLQNKSGDYTAVVIDAYSVLNFTANATLTLPPAVTAGSGFTLYVQAASGVTITLDGNGSETINGFTTYTITSRSRGILHCNGSAWALWYVQDQFGTVLNNPTIIAPSLSSVREPITLPGTVTGTVTLDANSFGIIEVTLGGNITFAISNVPGSGFTYSATLIATQDATGSRTITWPAGIRWSAGVAPTLTTTPAKTDIISLLTHTGGSSWFGFVSGQNF